MKRWLILAIMLAVCTPSFAQFDNFAWDVKADSSKTSPNSISGSNLVKPVNIGDIENGNYFQIDSQGRYKAIGDSAVAWDDLRVPVSNLKLNPVNEKPDFAPFSAGRAFLFDPDSAESTYFAVQIPHNYKLGTDLEAHIHWAPIDVTGGAVQWGIRYSLANIGADLAANPAASDTASAVGSAIGTAFNHKLTDIATIDGSGINSVSSMIIATVYRIAGATADSYTNDAALLEIDFHYQIDSLGSRWEMTK